MSKHNLFIFNFKNISFGLKLVLAVGLLCCYINYILPQYEQGYDAALIDKVSRLQSINDPKIVLLGNSNLAFGMDSKSLEEAMGMPVVNMGLHGSLGNAFLEQMGKLNVNSGDIYILCHSDYNDDNRITDATVAWLAIENHFQLWKILRLSDIGTMIGKFPIYLKKSLNLYSSGTGNQDPGGVYARNAFNKYGDVELLREKSIYTEEIAVDCPTVGEITVKRINDLNSYLESKGAVLLVAGYPIGNGKLTADSSEFQRFQETLIEKLDCQVISNYEDYMLDYSYFYDANYLHLTTKGAAIRTEQLIYDLKSWEKYRKDASIKHDRYTNIAGDVELSHIDNCDSYLDMLVQARDRYTIFVSVQGNISDFLITEMNKKLGKLGLEINMCKGKGYVSVIENGKIIMADSGYEKINIVGKFDNSSTYSISSGGKNSDFCSSIVLNGIEYSREKPGINFVVYSNESHRVLDEVSFDMSESKIALLRK